MSSEPPTETEVLRAQIDELAASVHRLTRWRNLTCLLALLGGLAAGIVGWAGAHLSNRRAGSMPGISRIETGSVLVELTQQTLATGVVAFSKPFARRPLVFVCEAGHAGLFLACKTDAVSESGFTWAVGAGPARRDYQTELAWIAFEPE